MWGRPSVPLLVASSLMMQIFSHRFAPFITLKLCRLWLDFVNHTMLVCLKGFYSESRKHDTLVPSASLLIYLGRVQTCPRTALLEAWHSMRDLSPQPLREQILVGG